jgi:leader peptidase (prepilin peptidase) / N-methyltransferase
VTLAVIAFVLGLFFGSFLNVCIARLPHHESIVRPRSHCPRCGRALAWYDNVPLASFALLRGRCRQCGVAISPRYPLVEFAVAVSWFTCVLLFGPTTQAVLTAVLCWLLIGLFVTDIETYTLPDALTIPGVALGLAFAAADAPPDHRLAGFAHAVIAACVFAGLFLAIRTLYWLWRRKEGMGLGDIKLIALIGSFLLFSHTTVALFVAVLSASLFSVALVIRKKADAGQTRIPFGAFLAAGGLISAFAGSRILDWYFSFFY